MSVSWQGLTCETPPPRAPPNPQAALRGQELLTQARLPCVLVVSSQEQAGKDDEQHRRQERDELQQREKTAQR